jgi:PAP2 superfamily
MRGGTLARMFGRPGKALLAGADPVDVEMPARARWWTQLAVIAWLYVIYDQINNLSSASGVVARRHAMSILRFEQRLGIDIELATNEWLTRYHWLSVILANFYNIAHLLVTFVVLAWLWWFRPAIYRPLRNALAGMNVIGLVVFWSWPVAPPRWLPELGYIDTVREVNALGSVHEGALAERANEFAAMPSLHVAWALWCAVALWRAHRGATWRIVGVAHVVLTVVAIVTTANHWLVDAVAGVATAIVPIVAADAWRRWRAVRTISLISSM